MIQKPLFSPQVEWTPPDEFPDEFPDERVPWLSTR